MFKYLVSKDSFYVQKQREWRKHSLLSTIAHNDLASMSALRLLQTMSEAGRMWLSSFTGQEEDNIQILPLKLSPTLGQWCGQIITSVYIHVISKQVDIRVSLMRSVK